MSINKPTIEEHIKYIGTPCTWGTHIEILAAATYYKLPIYFVSRKNDESVFKWNLIKPLRADHMNYPVLTDENEFLLHTEATHFEMVHHCSHYNSIICTDTEDRASGNK